MLAGDLVFDLFLLGAANHLVAHRVRTLVGRIEGEHLLDFTDTLSNKDEPQTVKSSSE